jgi:hypothetical protein
MEAVSVDDGSRRQIAKSRREPFEEDGIRLDDVSVGVDDGGGVHAGGAPIASW